MAEPVLAIDFGTSTTSAALVLDGTIRLIKEPTTGTWSWPSSVYLDGDALLVGTPAERLKRADPACYGSEFKRELGQDAAITLGDWSFSPQELATAVLSALRSEAERQSGVEISRAVLTVPAEYGASDTRRRLMLEAAEAAGFAAAELIAEPVAATYAPVAGGPFPPGSLLLVYDLGGGTFDATLVRVGERSHEVLAHATAEDPAGRGIDALLFARVQATGGEQLAELLHPDADPDDEDAQLAVWRVALELADFTRQLKHQLSDAPRAKDFFTMALLPVEIERPELDGLVQPLVGSTVSLCQDLLARTELTSADLAAVLMVGGGCRMPLVSDTLAHELAVPLVHVEDPQVAVVQGAARWATSIPERRLTPMALAPNEMALRWEIPGGTARLLRWLVEPGRRYEAGFAVAQIRLADGAVWDLVADHPGWALRMHATVGAPVSTGDWLLTATIPTRTQAPAEDTRGRITGQPHEAFRVAHDDVASGVAFSPDGRQLASASWDKTGRLWDTVSGLEVLRVQHAGTVLSIAMGSDGRVATAGSDGAARVWDTADGMELLRLTHTKEVTGVAFSPDGRRLATASCDRAARVWDAVTGAELTQVVHGKEVTGVEFSPDGRRLATASRDRTARVWDAVNGAELLRLAHGDMVLAVSFSPDGRRLATASRDNCARVWDLTRAAEGLRLTHDSPVVDVAFSPDGTWLATASSDEWARLWDTATGRELLRLPHKGAVRAVAFSPDGRWLATADTDNAAHLWSITENA